MFIYLFGTYVWYVRTVLVRTFGTYVRRFGTPFGTLVERGRRRRSARAAAMKGRMGNGMHQPPHHARTLRHKYVSEGVRFPSPGRGILRHAFAGSFCIIFAPKPRGRRRRTRWPDVHASIHSRSARSGGQSANMCNITFHTPKQLVQSKGA